MMNLSARLSVEPQETDIYYTYNVWNAEMLQQSVEEEERFF